MSRRATPILMVLGAISVLSVTVLGGMTASTADATGPGEQLGTLVDLSAQRVLLGDTVAAAKWGTPSPIDDSVRETALLNNAVARSILLGLDPAESRQVFTDQIVANKAVQYGLHARWSAHPDQAPITRPDLNQVRSQLDAITEGLLTQLAATTDARADQTCPRRLRVAQNRVEHSRHLDAVHRDALDRALISVCR